MANNGWLGRDALPTKLEEANVAQLRNQVNNVQNSVNNSVKKGKRLVRVTLTINGHKYEAAKQWDLYGDLVLDMGNKNITLPCSGNCSGGCASGCGGTCSTGCSGSCGSSCGGCSGPGT